MPHQLPAWGAPFALVWTPRGRLLQWRRERRTAAAHAAGNATAGGGGSSGVPAQPRSEAAAARWCVESEGALVHDEHVQSKPRRTARNKERTKERQVAEQKKKAKRAGKKKEDKDAEKLKHKAVEEQGTPQKRFTLGEVAGLVDDDCTQRP